MRAKVSAFVADLKGSDGGTSRVNRLSVCRTLERSWVTSSHVRLTWSGTFDQRVGGLGPGPNYPRRTRARPRVVGRAGEDNAVLPVCLGKRRPQPVARSASAADQGLLQSTLDR